MAINRREFFTAVATTAALGERALPRRSMHPNILHIMVDQMQWAAIARRSECRTPNINRLAAEGLQFERSYTPVALCCPARAALISGAFPWSNGIYTMIPDPTPLTRDMVPGVVTFSQRLKNKGYRQGYVGKWHISSVRTPLDFGYDEVAAPIAYFNPKGLKKINSNPDGVPKPNWNWLRKQEHVDRWFSWPGSKRFPMWGHLDIPENQTRVYWIAESGIRMMKRFATERRPWHLWLSFEAPHDPYMPLKKYLDRYDLGKIPIPQSFYDTFEGKPSMHKKESETWGVVTEDDYRQGRAHYYAYCEEIDTQVGRILDALEATGQAENTLVTFTADHGDMVGAHRMWIKDWIPYEECHRIPMVLRWPARIRPGLVTHRLVQLHDLAYTYLEAAGAESFPYLQGRSLLPLAEDPQRSDWPDHILSAYYGDEFPLIQRFVITDRYKYVFEGIAMDECYDLQEDPQEMRNLVVSADHQEVIDDMRARLYELIDQFGDPYGDVGTKLPGSYHPSRWCAPRYLPRGKRTQTV